MIHTATFYIQSVMRVEAFYHYLVDERNLNFQPDNDFAGIACL